MEYFKELYKNIYDQKYVEKHFGLDDQKIIRDIKKYSERDPLMNIYITDLIENLINGIVISDEDLKKHIFIATKGLRKGNTEEIFKLMIERRILKHK